MVSVIQKVVRVTDAAIARVYLSMHRERSAVIAFLFHSVFRDEREIARNAVDPLQRTTLHQLRQFIEYYLRHDYRFVTSDELLTGLPADGRYALITFDDGYFNNTLVLPILAEYGVRAMFFISTGHVQQNKCFWWDVLYREGMRQGQSHRQVYRDIAGFKSLTAREIEDVLARRFGRSAFVPRGDIDRPLSPDELRDFARSPYVHIGNHTADHAILTNYSREEVRRQVLDAQDALTSMTGRPATAIAYPNGAHDAAIVRTCRDIGLKVGFTTRPEKCMLPFDQRDTGLMRIGRFAPHGEDAMLTQCRTYRSDLLLYGRFRDRYLHLVRGKVGQ
jgi:peptidoglycan/xylan/chitin deacetylase (PgdA/CDA1 family)